MAKYWIWLGLAAALLWLLQRTRRSEDRDPSPSPSGSTEEAVRVGPEAEPSPLPIEDSLDLHAFSPRDVVSVTDEYLRQACRAGFVEVRLIHGKGTGFQRDRVRQLLSSHPLVARYGDAPPERGGWGATLVALDCGESKQRRPE